MSLNGQNFLLERPFHNRISSLFADTSGGAKASANLYALVETCKANGVDAYRYLTELFKALPYARSADDYEALLPWKLGQRNGDTTA